jgi:predicted ester cyclase
VFRSDFPDLPLSIEDMVAEGDRVAVRLTSVGTQTDPLDVWNAPDTGRHMEREVWRFTAWRVAGSPRSGSCPTT